MSLAQTMRTRAFGSTNHPRMGAPEPGGLTVGWALPIESNDKAEQSESQIMKCTSTG